LRLFDWIGLGAAACVGVTSEVLTCNAYAMPDTDRRSTGTRGLAVSSNSAFTLDGFVSQYNYGNKAEYTIMAGYKVGF